MGKDKEKPTSKQDKRPMSMSLDHESTKHPWPEVEAIQRDRMSSQERPHAGHNDSTKAKADKKKGGLFSRFRKSNNDLSEWNKNDERLSSAVGRDELNKVLQLLGKKGVDPTKLDPLGHTAFHRAAEQGHLAIVEAFLSHKADPRAKDVQGRTPLSCAVRLGRTQVAGRLMQESDTLDVTDHNGHTALHHATIGGSADCVRLLISHHASLDAQDKGGCTALMYACKQGYMSICRELVENGANINCTDKTGRTPITYGAEFGHTQTCEYLVKKGANLQLADQEGNDAFAWAAKGGYKEIQTLFERAPTQANWSTDPAEDQASNHARQLDQNEATTADETTDVTPYNDELQHDKLDLSITPFFSKSDFSAAKVNYNDEDDDEFSSAIVPMHEMEQDTQQNEDQARSIPKETSSIVKHKVISDDVVSKDALHELEEENDILNAEVQRLTLENKHLKDRQRTEDYFKNKELSSSMEDVAESNKEIDQLQSEIGQLRTQLAEANRRYSVVVNEAVIVKRSGSAVNGGSSLVENRPGSAVNDSWMDSGDDEDSPREADRSDMTKQIAVLRSQVLELAQQNEQLQEQLKVLDEVNQNDVKHGKTPNGDIAHDAEYEAHFHQELKKLHQYIRSKRRPDSPEDHIGNFPESVTMKTIQKDIDILCIQSEASDSNTELQEENENLSRQLSDVLAESKKLHQEYKTLQDEHEALIDQMCSEEDTQQQYQQQIQEERALLQQEKDELTSLMQQVKAAMQQRDEQQHASQETVQMPRDNDAAVNGDCNSTEGMLTDLSSLKLETISLDIATDTSHAKRQDASGSVNMDIKSKHVEQEKTLQDILAEIKDNKHKLSLLENQLHDSTDTFRTLQLQIEQSQNELTASKSAVSGVEKQLKEQQIELEDLSKQKNERLSDISTLDADLTCKTKELARLDETLQEEADKLQSLKENLSHETEQYVKVKTEYVEMEHSLDQLRLEAKQEGESLEGTLARKQELENELKRLETLRNKQDEEQSETSDTEQEVKVTVVRSSNKINALHTGNSITIDEDSIQRIRDLELEICGLQETNQELMQDLESKDKLNSSFIDRLKEENERLRNENLYLIGNDGQQNSEVVKSEVYYQNECQILKRENSRLYDDIKALRNLIEISCADDKSKSEITYLRGQNEALSNERQQLETNNLELHTLMETLQQTLQKQEQQEKIEMKTAVMAATEPRRMSYDSDTDSFMTDIRAELEDLKDINADQRGELELLRTEKETLEAKITALQEAADRKTPVVNEEYELKLQSLSQENDALESEIRSLTQIREALDTKVAKLEKAQKLEIKQDDSKYLEKYRQTQSELEDIQEQLEHTQEENDQFLESIKQLQAQVEEQQKQADIINSLNEDNDVLVSEIRDLRKELDGLKNTAEKSDKLDGEHDEVLNQLRKENEELKEENKSLLREQLKMHVWKSANNDSDNEMNNSDNENRVVSVKTIHLSQSKSTEDKDSTESVNAELKEMKEQNTALLTQIEELHERLESCGAEHEADLTEEQERSQAEIDRYVDISKGLSQEIEKYKDLIEDLKDDHEAKVQDLMEEQDFLLEKIKALETVQASKDHHSYKEEDPLNEKDEIIQDLETQVEEFKEKLETLNKDIEVLRQENVRLKEEAKTNEEKAAAKDAQILLERLEKENAELKDQVKRLEEKLEEKSRIPSPVPVKDVDAESETIREMQQAIIKLQHELKEVDKRHKDIVNTYRTHLLAAAEGRMDPEVRDALMHIISLRSPREVSSC